MHKTQMYENLRDMLEREVKEVEKKNDLDPQSLEHIYKLTCAIKNVDKIMEKDMEREMGGMSNGYSRNEMMPNRSYGMNYGRYSGNNFRYSEDRGRNSYENYNGYSRDSAKDSMVNRLMQMADSSNEHDRMAIMDCIDKIR